MTLARWFALVVGGLVLAALLGLVVAFVALDRQSDRRAFLIDRVIPAEVLAGDISTALLDQETSVRGFLLAGDELYLDPYRAGRREERRSLAELRRLQAADDLAGLRDEQAEIERRAEAWRAQYAEPAIAARRGGGELPDDDLGRELFDAVREAIAQEREALVAQRVAAAEDVQQGGAQVRRLIIGGGVFVLLCVLVAALHAAARRRAPDRPARPRRARGRPRASSSARSRPPGPRRSRSWAATWTRCGRGSSPRSGRCATPSAR